MSQRSLRLSSEYFAEAEKKLKQKGWTRKQLADFAECSSQPVSKFFNGKSVERSIFIRICQELNLDVEQVTFTVNDEKIGS
ncbi:MAG: helix-turn-helix transcriptional regulator, partial [Cyanobacteria bacterium P01_A01_bin.40]